MSVFEKRERQKAEHLALVSVLLHDLGKLSEVERHLREVPCSSHGHEGKMCKQVQDARDDKEASFASWNPSLRRRERGSTVNYCPPCLAVHHLDVAAGKVEGVVQRLKFDACDHEMEEVPGSGYGGANELSVCKRGCGYRVRD